MKKKNWNLGLLKKLIQIEYLALILSVTAIWATYQQNITNKEFYQLSVKPLFKHGKAISPGRLVYSVHNYGLGVAIIDSIKMNYNGKEIGFKAMADTIMANYTKSGFASNYGHSRDIVIKKDKKHDLFNIFYQGKSEIEGFVSEEVYKIYNKEYENIIRIFNNLKVTIYYKDLYNNELIYSSEKEHFN